MLKELHIYIYIIEENFLLFSNNILLKVETPWKKFDSKIKYIFCIIYFSTDIKKHMLKELHIYIYIIEENFLLISKNISP